MPDPQPAPPVDVAIDTHLGHIEIEVEAVKLDLVKLRYYLDTKPDVEFTPAQAQRLGDMLIPLALLANEIMVVDLDRTRRREGVAREFDA